MLVRNQCQQKQVGYEFSIWLAVLRVTVLAVEGIIRLADTQTVQQLSVIIMCFDCPGTRQEAATPLAAGNYINTSRSYLYLELGSLQNDTIQRERRRQRTCSDQTSAIQTNGLLLL